MADQKLISSIFDLTKNVDKLSGDIKKNAASTSELAAAQEKSAESTKDFGKVAESIKGLDLKSLKGEFSELTKSIGGLDFKSLSGDLKALDFKGLTKDLKSLDFKGLTQGLKGLDLKGVIGGAKGLDLKGISGSLGDIGSLKDTISGSLGGLLKGGGKGILGSFEDGGDVKKTGNYLVGERGPEVVNLKTGSAVIPNNILKERQDILKKLGSDAPSEKEISRKRNELLLSDPTYYDNEPGWLEEDINSYLEGLQGKSTSEFTQEDLKKLSKPVDNKAEELVNPSAASTKNDKKEKNKEDKTKLKEKKDGLFSKIFGKKDKEESEGENKKSKFSDLISKGGDLLKENKDVLKGKVSELGLGGISDIIKPKKDGGGPGGMMGLNKKSAGDDGSGLLSSIKGLSKKSGDSESGGIKSDIVKLSKKEKKAGMTADSLSTSPNQSPDNKQSPVASPPIASTEPSSTTAGKEKSDSPSSASSMEGGQLTAADGAEIKMLLARIASTLEGTLSVSALESPFRPDSRKF